MNNVTFSQQEVCIICYLVPVPQFAKLMHINLHLFLPLADKCVYLLISLSNLLTL